MKTIYLPKYNIALVFFLKSGSTLLINFFGKFFTHIGIRAEECGLDKIYREHKDCKVYIFTRNPIDRLVSIFYDRFNTSNALYPISSFKDFLNGYNQFSQTNKDPHHFPQLYNLMVVSNPHWNGVCDLSHYLNEDYSKVIPSYLKYTIIKIEELDVSIKLVLGMYENANDLTMDWELFNSYDLKGLKIIDELDSEISEKDKTYGVLLYNFMATHFSKTHHKNLTQSFMKILQREENIDVYNKLLSFTKKEAEFYGY